MRRVLAPAAAPALLLALLHLLPAFPAGASSSLPAGDVDLVADPARYQSYVATLKAVAGSLNVVRRPHGLPDLLDAAFARHNHTYLDKRYLQAREPVREAFALAVSDTAQTDYVFHTLPEAALGVRLLDAGAPEDLPLRARLLEVVRGQIQEIVRAWRPLQRPGWTCTNLDCPDPERIQDGVFLATGRALAALQLALDLLPTGSFTQAESEEIESFLLSEAHRVVDDFQREVPWYVQVHKAYSNQWIVPAAGLLVVAAARHDRPEWRPLHAAGLSYVRESLDSLGDDGDPIEGTSYARVLAVPLFLAAWYTDVHALSNLARHPFFRAFPGWLVSRLQPGRQVINAGDCGGCTAVPRDHRGYRRLLFLAELTAGSGVARWANDQLFDGDAPLFDVFGYLGQAQRDRPPPEVPTKSAWHPASGIYNWRSSFEEDSSAFWVRGRSRRDLHFHEDYGHVSLHVKGRPVLIEGGLPPSYGDPDLSLFKGPAMHNVLAVRKDGQPLKAATHFNSPFRTWDAEGDRSVVELDLGSIHPDVLKHYTRRMTRVGPGIASFTIEDSIELATTEAVELRLRWHTASQERLLPVRQDDGSWQVKVPVEGMTLEGRLVAPAFCEVVPLRWSAADDNVADPFRLRDYTLPSKGHYGVEVFCRPSEAEFMLSLTISGGSGSRK